MMLKKSNNIFGAVRFYVFALIIGLLIAVPFYWMAITSLKTESAVLTYPIEWFPTEITLENYASLFSSFSFGRIVLNSCIVSVAYTFVALVSCCMAAFAFAKLPFRGRDTILKIFIATLMIPAQSTLVPLFMIFNGMGLTNSYFSVILPSLFRVTGIFMLVQNMKTIPNDYIDAARIDGASYFKILFRIIVPLLGPAVATVGIITFMDSWNEYLWPLVMLTDTDMMTLPVALSTLSGMYERNFGVQMAGSLISIIPIVIVYLAAQRRFKDGLSLGGIKG